MKKKIFENKILFVLIVAFALRLIGITYGLPAMYNSDEPFNILNALAYGAKKSLEPTYFVYPALYSYLLAAVYGLYFVLGSLAGSFQSAMDFGARYFMDATGFFLWGRLLSVVIGVFTVWLVYRIGVKTQSERVGLFAAILLALSYAHADLSHWILPEAPLMLLCAMSLFFIMEYAKAGTRKALVLAALFAGLAISTKYNSGFIFLPLLISSWLRNRKNITQFTGDSLIAVTILLLGFLLGSPYWLVSPGKYLADLSFTASHVNTGMIGHTSNMPFFWPLWSLIENDLLIGLLFVASFVYFLFGSTKWQSLLLWFIAPTLLYVGMWNRTGIHYIAPIMPALALLAAHFSDQILSKIKKTTIAATLVIVILLPSFLKIVWQDFRLTRPDSRAFATEWIEANVPDKAKIAYENYVYGPNLFDPGRYLKNGAESQLLPLEIKEKLLQESFLRKSYQMINLRKHFQQESLGKTAAKLTPYLKQLLQNQLPKLASVKNSGASYIMTSSDNYARYFTTAPPKKATPLWHSYYNARKFYESVFNSDELSLVKEFKPHSKNLGPTIRLYLFKDPTVNE